MKKLLMLLVFLPFISLSQEYSKIVEVPGKPVDKLYSIAREWFAITFKSANNVLQMDDPIAGKLIGKGSTEINESFVAGWAKIQYLMNFEVEFTVVVSLKEGKYKCDVMDIFVTPTVQGGTYPVQKRPYSELLLQKEYFKNGSDPDWLMEHGTPEGQKVGKMIAKTSAEVNKCYSKFFDDMEIKMNELLASLETKMKKQDDNW